jgi:hypothetical protein
MPSRASAPCAADEADTISGVYKLAALQEAGLRMQQAESAECAHLAYRRFMADRAADCASEREFARSISPKCPQSAVQAVPGE